MTGYHSASTISVITSCFNVEGISPVAYLPLFVGEQYQRGFWNGYDGGCEGRVSSDGKTISWYGVNGNAHTQFNYSGYIYYYVAIG